MLGFPLDIHKIQGGLSGLEHKKRKNEMKKQELVLLILLAIIAFYAMRFWMKKQVEVEVKALLPRITPNAEKPIISGFAGGIVMAQPHP
jgi:hypothetical protein